MITDYFFPLSNHRLIRQFTIRDIRSQYQGSIIGIGWAFLTPLLMLSAYFFVFRIAFNSRWPSENDSNINFALQIYTGLIIYNLFADSLRQAPRLIVSNANFVKKVVFPLETLAWSVALSCSFHAAAGLLTLLILSVISQQSLPISLVALPLVVGSMFPLMLGLVWLVSALGVYIRDTTQITSLIIRVMLFLSPVFFPVKILPESIQPWLYLNPLAPVIEQTRHVILNGQWPDWSAVATSWLISILVAYLGARWFNFVRKGFADVL